MSPASTKTKTEKNVASDPEPTAEVGNDGEATKQRKPREAAHRMFEVLDELPENPERESSGGFTPQLANIVRSVLTEAPEDKWVAVTEYANETGARNSQKQFETRVPDLDENGNQKVNKRGTPQFTSPDYNRKTGESRIIPEVLAKMGVEVEDGVQILTANRRKNYRDQTGKVTKKASILAMKWIRS